MGLLDRITRVIKAGMTSLLGDAEDPEKILEQTVSDMEGDLIRLRQSVAQAIATQKRTERQSAQANQTGQEWYQRAQLALKKGNEVMAKEALTRRKTYVDTAQMLDQQVTQQREIVTQLKTNMQTLERKLAEARTKKDMYIARARSAKASQQLNEMLGGMGTQTSMAAFDRMAEKVEELEAQSEAIAELNRDNLDQRFAELEGEGSVDAELAKLKASMNTPTLPPNQ